jgi:predicted MPP superfamily phosphohydrolase
LLHLTSSPDTITGRDPRNFGSWRVLWEQVQAALTPNDWPAWLAERLGAPLEVRTQFHRIEVPRWSAPRPLRVAFASDLHAGPYTPARLLTRAANALAATAPDLLLLGGDFVCLRSAYVDRVVEALSKIPAPLGRYAVLGNHDYWAGAQPIVRALERAGIVVLINASRRLGPPFGDVSVGGLDDHMAGHPDAAAALDPTAPVQLVLMHAPSGLLDLASARFTLALAGHTHGGQIALGPDRPVIVPWGALSRTYCAGEYDIPGQGRLLVSRGVGCSTLPFRLNSPAEVHLCTLG